MNLFELSPTIHWTPSSTEVRSVAIISTDEHKYELVVRCNKSVADHLKGWITKIIDHEKDVDSGRYVELSCKENRSSFDGVEDTFTKVVKGIAEQADKQKLKYVYLFSTTPHRREVFAKLTKKLAKKLEWEVYQDRNYFIVYKPGLDIHQPD